MLPLITACGSPKPSDTSIKKSRIVRYHYSIHGMMAQPSAYAELEQKDGRVLLTTIKGYAQHTYIVDEAVLDTITDIFYSEKMYKYEDSYRTKIEILDGDSWSMEVKMEDGTYKSSGGYCAWPDGNGLKMVYAYLQSLADRGYREIQPGMPEDGSNLQVAYDCTLGDSIPARLCLEIRPDGLVAGNLTRQGTMYHVAGKHIIQETKNHLNLEVYDSTGKFYGYCQMNNCYGDMEGSWHGADNQYRGMDMEKDTDYKPATTFFVPTKNATGTYRFTSRDWEGKEYVNTLTIKVEKQEVTFHIEGASMRGTASLDGTATLHNGAFEYVDPETSKDGEQYGYRLQGRFFKDFVSITETNSWHKFDPGELLGGYYIKVK